jgi:hypothetical protein
MGGQLATVAVTGRGAISRFALDDSVGLFLRRIENALGDLDVLKRQVMLLVLSFSDLAPNLSRRSSPTITSSRRRASSA